MNATPELFPANSITPQEWTWVQDLIRDVQRDQSREVFAKSLWEWDLAVRQFRKVEYRRIVLATPTETDRLHHTTCLHALLAQGHLLLIQARKFSDTDLTTFGVSYAQIVAYVEELEQSYREGHHGFSESELKAAREKIFGAAS